ncbi:MAG: glycosyltransferase family 4 protein [Acidobacteria bacterium]|nr:glycosyltransferase family 4 protein [Acidobacteriota bacterium]
MESVFFGTALIATALGIALFRRYGRRVATFDVPNERSSHTTPTLRGSGIVIVIVCLFLYTAAALFGFGKISWAFIAGALVVSIVSWLDDARDLPAWVRLTAHGAAAAILLASVEPIRGFGIPAYGTVSIGTAFSYVVSFLWIVWMINAYNFMDGIDGIAGAQATVAGVGWAMIGIWAGDPAIYIFGGVIAFSSLGFLVHNWSPARVFMGDVGSAFLGYTLAAFPFLAQPDGLEKRPWLFTAAISFVWLFLFDTAFTLARRLLKKEKVWLAHRTHLYQRLVIAGWGHASASLLYCGSAVLVSAAFIGTLMISGNAVDLSLFMYAIAPAIIVFLAFRKKD